MNQQKLKQSNYAIIDFETGGINKEGCSGNSYAITEVGMIILRADTHKVMHKYSSYIKPYYNENLIYDPQALTATNLSIELLEKEGVDAKVVAKDIYNLLKESNLGLHYHKPIIVCHNAGYDIPFLYQLFNDYKLDISKVLDGYYDIYNNYTLRFIDTMMLSRLKWNNESYRHNLLSSCERAGISLIDAHKAINDAEATSELFKYFFSNKNDPIIKSAENNSNFRNNFTFEF